MPDIAWTNNLQCNVLDSTSPDCDPVRLVGVAIWEPSTTVRSLFDALELATLACATWTRHPQTLSTREMTTAGAINGRDTFPNPTARHFVRV